MPLQEGSFLGQPGEGGEPELTAPAPGRWEPACPTPHTPHATPCTAPTPHPPLLGFPGFPECPLPFLGRGKAL